jgi:outer membrane protein OmpU
MNKLTKIGVSALAGSLVAFAANAGELSVSGGANLTYTTETNGPATSSANNIGNKWGHDSDLVFNGSGDMNGYTVSFYAAIDAGGGAYASNQISLDMGDMGKITFDQGVGGNGASAIDDKTPSAFEESWDGVGTTDAGYDGLTGSQNVFKYTNTVAGFGINAAYDAEIDDARTAGGANSSNGSTNVDGSNWSVALTNATLIDGLDFGVGYSSTDVKDGTTTTTDKEVVLGYANYTVGPVVLGVTMGESSGGVQGHDSHTVEGYGIAFNVNENLSLSYNNNEVTYNRTSGNTDLSQEREGIAIAYTMGAASIKVQNNDSSGSSSSATTTEERTEVNLSLAF